MKRRVPVVIAAVALAACGIGDRGAATSRRYAVGHEATPAEIAALDVDVGPDGQGLPPGRGTVAQGELLFAQTCAVCHGPAGRGLLPKYPALVGRSPAGGEFAFGTDPNTPRTIGDYWPYATTLFDYVRRAMPQPAPGMLTNDQVYALTAWLLAANKVIPMDATLDAASLKAVKMPAAGRFVRDNRRGGPEIR